MGLLAVLTIAKFLDELFVKTGAGREACLPIPNQLETRIPVRETPASQRLINQPDRGRPQKAHLDRSRLAADASKHVAAMKAAARG